MQDNNDRPSVAAVPTLIYVAALSVGIVLDVLWSVSVFSSVVRYGLGIPLAMLGFAVLPFIVPHYHRAGTPYDVRRAASALVTTGAHRISRNPGYVAITIVYVGAGVAYDNIWMLVLLAPLLTVMHYGVVLREEQHLDALFGDEYRRYKASVRRWL